MAKIRESAYVNDMVMYRNACEERKLKFTLLHIDRLKEQYSRQKEKEKMFFAVQHLTVPSSSNITRLLTRDKNIDNNLSTMQRSVSAPITVQLREKPSEKVARSNSSFSGRENSIDTFTLPKVFKTEVSTNSNSPFLTTPMKSPNKHHRNNSSPWLQTEKNYKSINRNEQQEDEHLLSNAASVQEEQRHSSLRRTPSVQNGKEPYFVRTSRNDDIVEPHNDVVQVSTTSKMYLNETSKKVSFFRRITPKCDADRSIPNLDGWYAKCPKPEVPTSSNPKNTTTKALLSGQIKNSIGLNNLNSKHEWERTLNKMRYLDTSKTRKKGEEQMKNNILREKWKKAFSQMKNQRHSTFRSNAFDTPEGESMTLVKFLPKNKQSMYIKDAQFAQRFL